MGQHYDNRHRELLPEDMDGYRWVYYLLTGKDRGACVICKNETDFNRSTMKYCRFCNNPACKAKYREQFKDRMIGKYGKIHLLDDPEIQKKMLAARRISGEYTWSDRSVKLPYVGTYELDFLVYLDRTLRWKSSDIMAPSPHIYRYEYDGKSHFYIPDFFIPSMSLEVEIKNTGAKNINDESRKKDDVKEELMKSNANYFRFIKLVDKHYQPFLDLLKGDSPDG